MDRAAVTKSRFDHETVVERAILPRIGTMTMVRETITTMSRRDGETGLDGSGDDPNTAINVIESKRLGMERTTLNIEFAIRSKNPRLNAPMTPMADPTSDPTITEIAAIMSEYREPSTNWANMS
jgi:hypothetical protein